MSMSFLRPLLSWFVGYRAYAAGIRALTDANLNLVERVNALIVERDTYRKLAEEAIANERESLRRIAFREQAHSAEPPSPPPPPSVHMSDVVKQAEAEFFRELRLRSDPGVETWGGRVSRGTAPTMDSLDAALNQFADSKYLRDLRDAALGRAASGGLRPPDKSS